MMYPDIANVSGKRVLLKSDGGPGRTDLEYLSQSNLDGLIHAPGLPNGTKFQELDNVFDLTKATMENNRKKIFDKSCQLYGKKAKVGFSDVVFILFGGTRTFYDGSTLFLPNSYAASMTKKRLESAIKKCGYVPATRAALESGELRHEIVLDADGSLDNNKNDLSVAKILLELEAENHDVVN